MSWKALSNVRVKLTNVLMVGAIVALAALLALLYRPRPSVLSEFHKRFYDDPNTWLKNTWMGIPTQQNPNDVWITQEIIAEVRPDIIVETGTNRGGSALLWATILEQVNPAGHVITVDIEDKSADARAFPIAEQRITFLTGSSTSSEVFSEIARRAKDKKVLVILDSDHRRDHVAEELRMYSKLVNEGSYIIVQDTNVNGHPVYPDFGPGPMEAVRDFLNSTDEFEVDHERERLLFTMHPHGFLKRVR